jgi:hypothetical protein
VASLESTSKKTLSEEASRMLNSKNSTLYLFALMGHR